jgi:CHAD domain-containing protein
MPVEREVKLLAPPGFVVPDLDGVAPGITAVPLTPQSLEATYYDTPDLRLARSGASLRYRTGEGAPRWTLKLPKAAGGPGLVRTELEFEGEESAVPAEAASLARAYVRTSTLGRVARLSTIRQRIELQDELGVARAVLSDDEVSAYDDGGLTDAFREIEVESLAGGDHLLEPTAELLVRAGAAAGDPRSKVGRALGAAASAPADVPCPKLGKRATAGDTVRAAICASVARLLRHDAGVRLGDDIENVHQARVATRRMRSDLRTFRSVLDEAWANDLRTQLSWLADLLGAVRDLDVLDERLHRQADDLADDDRPAAGEILERLDVERAEARRVLLAAMDSDRYVELLDTLVAAAVAPVLTPEAEQPARTVLAQLVRKSQKHVDNAVAALTKPSVDEELHNVRIRAKRARYAADAAAPVWKKPARKLASAMASVQSVLGDLQDAVVAEQWLRGNGRASIAQSFVAGELVAMQHAAMAASRRDFPRVWRAASSSKLRSWLR